MFPKIIKTKTRVFTNKDTKPVVQFYDTTEKLWGEEIALNFNCAGIAIFILDMDPAKEEYIFFGALQKTASGGTPDTNWDFKINVAGNMISFNNDCKNEQNINVKLTLIPRGIEDIKDVLISADPIFKNEPD
ncbi:MAG: hypothetical protein ACI9C4_001787 [Paraglaciecola sp.]|jgi:hypothetical protein